MRPPSTVFEIVVSGPRVTVMSPCWPFNVSLSPRPRRPRPSGRTRRAPPHPFGGAPWPLPAPRLQIARTAKPPPWGGPPCGSGVAAEPVSPHGRSPAWACSTASASVAGPPPAIAWPAKNAPPASTSAATPAITQRPAPPAPLRTRLRIRRSSRVLSLTIRRPEGRPRCRAAAAASAPKPPCALDAVAITELATTVPLSAVSPVTITVSPGWISLGAWRRRCA